jgi:hypothetical protein
MAQLLRIFISATTDLESYRDVVGRTLAELPVQVGAEIRRCQPQGTSYETLFELISNVDRVFFLMGSDITAPAGVEWELTMKLQRPLLPIRQSVQLTPAGQQFLRRARSQIAPTDWYSFHSSAELARIVALDLIDILLHPSNRYGISLTELDRLTARQRLLSDQPLVDQAVGGGTEGGGIILDSRPVIR